MKHEACVGKEAELQRSRTELDKSHVSEAPPSQASQWQMSRSLHVRTHCCLSKGLVLLYNDMVKLRGNYVELASQKPLNDLRRIHCD